MMSKFTTKSVNHRKPFKPKSIKEKGDIKEKIINRIEASGKAEIDHAVKTNSEDHLIEVGLSMDEISEKKTSGEKTYWRR